jgi:hypothetical protein
MMPQRTLHRRYGRATGCSTGCSTGGLHARIATALRWPMRDVQSMSLHSLRELVRPVSRKLADEIADAIQSGRCVT